MGFINTNGTYWNRDNTYDDIFAEDLKVNPNKHKEYNYYNSCLDTSAMPDGNANNTGYMPDTINLDDIF